MLLPGATKCKILSTLPNFFSIFSPSIDFSRLARYTSLPPYGNDKSGNKAIGSIQHYLKNYNIIMASEAKSSR
jgi:hypothetical protein